MGTFKILVNRNKKWAVSLKRDVARFLVGNGHTQSARSPDFTVVIGGDGTLYYYLDELEGPNLMRTELSEGLIGFFCCGGMLCGCTEIKELGTNIIAEVFE